MRTDGTNDDSLDRRRVLQAGVGMMLGGNTTHGAARAAEGRGWQPAPQLLADLEKRGTTWLFRERDVPAYTLPDPLLGRDGVRVTTQGEWETRRRPETLDLFRQHVYGHPPRQRFRVTGEVMESAAVQDGRALRKLVRLTCEADGRRFSFPYSLLIPQDAPGRVPVFLLINNRAPEVADATRAQKNGFWPAEALLARGYATAVFRTWDVDPDTKDETQRPMGVRGIWPEGGGTPGRDAWATLSAWAWAASRVLDSLTDERALDAKRVAIVGHSRGGKTALWAGAQDPRFALVISNDSGCGGAALSRRRFGETVTAINRGFPYWFCDNFKRFNDREPELPVDQHQLLALIAPRGLYVASADADFWADQRGEFLSLAHAAPVYGLFGHPGVKPDEMPPLDSPLVRGRIGYHIRRGGHDLTPYDWERFMDFADALWGPRAR